jgi:hypothetical protein
MPGRRPDSWLRKTLQVSALAALGVTLAIGCGNDPPAVGDLEIVRDDTKDTNLRDGTEVLEPELSGSADVQDGKITFPNGGCDRLSKIRPGTVIVGDSGPDGSKNPEGFLVKVVSVQCTPNGTVVNTENASLSEAFNTVNVDKEVDGPMDFNCNRELFRITETAKTAAGRTVPVSVYAKLECGLNYRLKHKVKIDFKFPNLNSADVRVTGDAEAKIALVLGADLAPGVDPKTRAELAGKLLNKVYTEKLEDKNLAGGKVQVGIVGLPFNLRYRADLACDFSFTPPVEARAESSAKGSVTLGFTYAASKLAPVFDKSFALNPLTPSFTKDGVMRGQCAIVPSIEFRFVGKPIAELRSKIAGGLDGESTCGTPVASPPSVPRTLIGQAQASASASVKLDLSTFGLKKLNKECTLFAVDGKASYTRSYSVAGDTVCAPVKAPPLPPLDGANPESCFGEAGAGAGGDAGAVPAGPIPGTCTHDVCVPGEKMGQACDACTQKVCDKDPYCCKTYWGVSCFAMVERECGRKCQ